MICFYLFEINAKNTKKAEVYLKEMQSHINEIKVSKHVEIFKSECLKEFIEKVITENKEEGIINILKNDLVNQTIFDDYYKDVLEKLEK